jgi:predicted nucleic acid-binding Zn ribbon protein
VPIFFKGKGFYSTDYGKKGRRRDSTDSEKAKSTDGDKKPEKTEAKKTAAD